jgi:hypothetical protein
VALTNRVEQKDNLTTIDQVLKVNSETVEKLVEIKGAEIHIQINTRKEAGDKLVVTGTLKGTIQSSRIGKITLEGEILDRGNSRTVYRAADVTAVLVISVDAEGKRKVLINGEEIPADDYAKATGI